MNDSISPLISVALPAYKPYFLKKAISSVLHQSYKDFELIIINDCSPYNLDEIVSGFSDSRIRYYKNSVNLGKEEPVKNWNECLKHARGEYFVLFSDDDILHQDFLCELIILSKKYPNVDLFHTRVSKINSNDQVIGFTPLCPEYESVIELVWHTVNGYRNLYVTEFLCRTEPLRKIGGFYNLPLAWGSDYVTWFALASSGGVAYSPKPLCSWRSSEFNISAAGDSYLRLKALKGYRKWMIEFLNSYVAQNNVESEQLIQTRNLVDEFFSKKREYLLGQAIQKMGIARTLINIPDIYVTYDLPLTKLLFQYIKALK